MIDHAHFIERPAAQALGWTLLHFVWQGALLGAGAYALLRALRSAPASTRYVIGVATLGAMLASATGTFVLLSRQTPQIAAVADAAVTPSVSIQGSGVTGWVIADLNANPSARSLLTAPRQPRPFEPLTLEPWTLLFIVSAWFAGVLVLSFRLIGGWMLTRQLAGRAVEHVSPSLEAAARDIARRLQLRRGVSILESGAVAVPTLLGWVKPIVLLPTAALAGLSPDQLQAILAHELAHVRRHDYVSNLLQSVVETLLFYHPAIWWVSARVREEREHCCDDLAVEVCGDRLVYVSALAELTTIVAPRGFALAATDGSLVGRVRRILGTTRQGHETPTVWPLVAMLVLLAGSVATFRAAPVDDMQSAPTDGPIGGSDGAVAGGHMGGGEGGAIGGVQDEPVGGVQGERTTQAQEDANARADENRAKLERARAMQEEIRAQIAERRRVEEQARQESWYQRFFDPQTAAVLPVPPVPPAPPAVATPLAPPVPPVPPVLQAPPTPFTPPALPAPPVPFAPFAPPAPPALSTPPTPFAPPALLALPAPPTSFAPAAPPALPVPPAPPALPEIQTSGSGNISWSDNNEKVSVKWTGAFRLSDDERDISWIEEGATVTITDGVIFASRIDLKGLSGGRIARTFSKNGFAREYEPDGRAFLAQALDKIVRRSGMFAKDRVARFLKEGGPDRVLEEMTRLGTSSYVKRVYYTELLKQATLTEPLLSRVLERMPTDVTSDHDRGTLLASVLALPAVTDGHRVSIARAARAISSDYDQRRTLTAVMASTPISGAVASAILEATSTVTSSHDRAVILSELAQQGGVTASTAPAFMDLVRSMPSSYDQRRVLTTISVQPALASAVAVEAVKAAGAMTSSHDQSVTLMTFIERGGLTDASADAFFASASEIGSSHDLSRLLRAVAAQPTVSSGVLLGVLRVASKIGSSHDRATLLVDIAGKHALSGQARDLYIAAAQTIGSTTAQNSALAALVRAERR